MRLSRTLATTAAIVTAGVMVLTLSPPQGTDAQWRENATAPLTGPSSDTFELTATDLPFPAPPWSSVNHRVSNSPRINVTNESARHSSWGNVVSTKVSRFPSESNGPTNLLPAIALDYELSPAHDESGEYKCELGTDIYWSVGGVGQIVEDTTYTRAQNKVSGATLAGGRTRSLCPAVRLNYATDTVTGQRAALLNHAGRALDITTVVNQKSESPATWVSEPLTVTSRYRISMPAPTTPSNYSVCRNTTQSGNPDGLGKSWGGFFWGWPDASTSTDKTGTPAMAGGWKVFRQNTDLTWVEWASASTSDRRQRAGEDSKRIYIGDAGRANNIPRKFKLRGYPFGTIANPDTSRYVESDWIATAHHTGTGPIGTWYCDAPETNPDAGPHNMP